MSLRPNNILIRFLRLLIIIAPAILFFSYYPNFHLGTNSSMNFEFSLPIIWLVIFDLIAFIVLIKSHQLKNIFRYWPWLLFPLFLTISIFWSLNSLRGFLTAGILWLIYFAGFSIYELRGHLKTKTTKNLFYKIFFFSTLIVCVWCWLQSILDLVGVSREHSLICPGCITQMFGFPHPNGFAIEPQFMGNLLLAPTLVISWIIIKKKNWKNFILLFIFASTLFLTFSRGAIYAFVIAAIFLTIYYMVYNRSIRSLIIWPYVILAFLFTLNFQGLFAEFSHTSDTYLSGISKSLNQLSLGVIDVRQPAASSEQPSSSEPSATFDGYVESSTDTRINLNDAAIDIWRQNSTNLVIGVGLGGAGEAMYVNGKTLYPKEIVQNQYFSLLLETGLIGIGLLILTVLLIIKHVFNSRISGLIFSLIVAYGITICFFAGLPNALHIYLMPIILLAIERN